MITAQSKPPMELFSWNKAGLLLKPGAYPDQRLQSHTALPFLFTSSDSCELFFTARDANSRSYILAQPLSENLQPIGSARVVLEPGALGAFDDSGVTNSWLTAAPDGRILLFYSGWSLGKTVPFYFYIGACVSEDGAKTFRRVSQAPVVERSAADPFLTASPCVLLENGIFRMWYVSGRNWEPAADGAKHYYNICYKESRDGINWRNADPLALPIICVDFATKYEYAFARPTVVKVEDGYLMWYSVRGDRYALGLAASRDGISWTRCDSLSGLEGNDFAFEDGVICYAHVAPVPAASSGLGKRWCALYNGNDYGKSGIGIAYCDSLPSVADVMAAAASRPNRAR